MPWDNQVWGLIVDNKAYLPWCSSHALLGGKIVLSRLPDIPQSE